jgi:hypothetical protein
MDPVAYSTALTSPTGHILLRTSVAGLVMTRGRKFVICLSGAFPLIEAVVAAP